MLRRLAKAMRAHRLLSPVTQASRIDEASCAWRYARMLAARECSTSAPCSPPSDAAGELRARRSSLNHTAVARLTNDSVLLKLLGGPQLSIVGGVKALDELVELLGPEEGLRRLEELMRRHLSKSGKERGESTTKRGWELGDGKYDAYAKQRGEARIAQGGKTPAGTFKAAVELGEATAKRGRELSNGKYDVYAKQRGEATARSRGHNIFPFKTPESLLPLIDELDKKGELFKCAHPGGQGPLKKGEFNIAAFCRLVTDHELVEKEWLAPIPSRPHVTKFQSNVQDNKELRKYVKDTITARYPDLFLP